MNRFIKISSLLITVFLFFLSSSQVKVQADNQINCSGRYVTLVNPVRGRNLWLDMTLKPIIDQYSASAKYNFPSTWLLQYDVLKDLELVDKIKSFEIAGERGVLLEVSKNLADESQVIYHSEIKWSNPGVIFLSAYSQSERRALIDTIFIQFKKDFGYYPKSVGAWWIDSYSLNYIKEKYGLNAILIVADQKTTDSYGVWGQWWGYPYYPSKYNILVPAAGDSLNAVVIQWAQRDTVLAYGEGSKYSNFSLQANDYIRSGKDTGYFKNLINSYLDCQNSIGQITIGMETGMESVAFNGEYLNQLKVLSELNDPRVVTMNDFAKDYKSVNKENPSKIVIGGWTLTPVHRENVILGDAIEYNRDISFSDYFIADKSNFLERSLPVPVSKNAKDSFPWFLVISLILGVYALRQRKFIVWICSSFFAIVSFGLIFRSEVEHGWQIFYGPVIAQIGFIQCLLVLLIFVIFIFVKSKSKYLLVLLLPLSFGFDRIISAFRYSIISGNGVVGFLIGRARITGLMFGGNGLNILNINFSITEANAFLKFPIDKIWLNLPVYFIVYPLAHIFLAIILYFLLIRFPKWIKIILLSFLVVFFVMQIIWIFGVDPRVVIAVK